MDIEWPFSALLHENHQLAFNEVNLIQGTLLENDIEQFYNFLYDASIDQNYHAEKHIHHPELPKLLIYKWKNSSEMIICLF